jgi:hypothetical protein
MLLDNVIPRKKPDSDLPIMLNEPFIFPEGGQSKLAHGALVMLPERTKLLLKHARILLIRQKE